MKGLKHGKLAEKNKIPLVLFALAAVGLVLLSSGGAETDTGEEVSVYSQKAKEDIERIAEEISGYQSTVVVTVDCGYTEEYALTQEGGYALVNGKPVSTGKTEPKLRGVTVVCKNGNDPGIQMKITSAICCAYGIGESRVYVCDGN